MAIDPESVSADEQSLPCSDCTEMWRRSLLVEVSGMLVCQECAKVHRGRAAARVEGASLLAQLDALVEQLLRDAGLAPREIRSTMNRATPEVLALIPRAAREVLRQGIVPARGFGLSGGAGVGKTGALASLVRVCVRERLKRELVRDGRKALGPWLLWLSWPETVNRFRVLSMQQGGLEEVDRVVTEVSNAEMLVLDDIGAERIKGSYVDDWAASQLDLVLDARYRNDHPTWFTTQKEREELIHKYGGRLFSRLCGENDLIELPVLRDRRMSERS